MTAAASLPPAPLWDWRDQTTCSLCAPHVGILRSADWRFLWRLARRRFAGAEHTKRLDRIGAEYLRRTALERLVREFADGAGR